MKLGSMQPYFFPYLGYFDLINYSNRWIVFDVVQYIRHGWINRNRILHPNNGWQYIIVPIKSFHQQIKIQDVEIDYSKNWRERILGQLMHYKKHAPFFFETMKFIEDCLEVETGRISKLNASILARICERLEIPFDYLFFSELDFQGVIHTSGDWALETAKLLDATEYINPPGGAHLFDPVKFREAGIKLTIQKFENLTYPCDPYQYEPALSIIDVMMWNSKEEIKRHLNDH